MEWNWEQNDWPDFTYKSEPIRQFEEKVISGNGLIVASLNHLPEEDRDHLKVEIISNEALKTSEIEGEYLNRDSLRSSISRHFGLRADIENIPLAEKGIANMMINLYEGFDSELTHNLLYKWHEMVMSGRTDLKDVGCYRKGKDAMQVVSGPIHKPIVTFEAPPSKQMKTEMNRFVKWFNESAPTSRKALSAITRAGIAHIYFVSIHPFEDGNGRIGRAIAEKALAQCLGQPSLISLATYIEEHKKQYYDALQAINTTNEITEWLTYFGSVVTEAQKYSQKLVEFLIHKTRMFDRLKDKLNERQEKALLRMFQEGPKGFKGGLSASNYRSITKASTPLMATRDLTDLVEKGALTKKGERKHTRYYLRLEP